MPDRVAALRADASGQVTRQKLLGDRESTPAAALAGLQATQEVSHLK
jgi:hypothetical protein